MIHIGFLLSNPFFFNHAIGSSDHARPEGTIFHEPGLALKWRRMPSVCCIHSPQNLSLIKTVPPAKALSQELHGTIEYYYLSGHKQVNEIVFPLWHSKQQAFPDNVVYRDRTETDV